MGSGVFCSRPTGLVVRLIIPSLDPNEMSSISHFGSKTFTSALSKAIRGLLEVIDLNISLCQRR
jgi:hypothetical protein